MSVRVNRVLANYDRKFIEYGSDRSDSSIAWPS